MAYAENVRRYFPAVRQVTYLNTATFGALPEVAVDAMKSSWQKLLEDGRSGATIAAIQDVQRQIREHLGQLFRVSPITWALTDGGAASVNAALWGVPLQPGDEIVYTSGEHPNVLAVLGQMRNRFGASLRCVDSTGSAEHVLSSLRAALSGRTKLVLCPHVAFHTGQRMPIEQVAIAAHEVGALCFVDGACGAGCDPLDLEASDIDLYALHSHAWLSGPDGAGALYVAPKALSRVTPAMVGRYSLASATAYDTTGSLLFAEGALRFQHSLVHLPLWTGWLESLRFLRGQIGWDYAFTRIRGLSGALLDGLYDVEGLTIATPRDSRAGLITFRPVGGDAEVLVRAAQERSIDICAVPKHNLVAVSVAVYNNEEDVSRLIHVVASTR